MTRKFLILLSFALCLPFGFAFCAPPSAKPATAPATRPKSAAAAVPDAELESAIRARFAKSKISADGFTVKVRNGSAILEGRTDVIQHKGTATRIARSAGARDVDNKIQISEAARSKARKNLERARQKAVVKR